jgi:hypothetical protein
MKAALQGAASNAWIFNFLLIIMEAIEGFVMFI